MNTHQLQLATAPFDAITSGAKTIESRLYDEKRQTIQIGDTIVFMNRENTDKTVSVKVIGLLRYETFHDLSLAMTLLSLVARSLNGLKTRSTNSTLSSSRSKMALSVSNSCSCRLYEAINSVITLSIYPPARAPKNPINHREVYHDRINGH